MSEPCPDCGGKGYTLSDPDSKQLVCWTCGGNMDEAMKAIKEKLEAAFSKDDQPEASPEDRPERSRIIGDIVKELVFGNGKEE